MKHLKPSIPSTLGATVALLLFLTPCAIADRLDHVVVEVDGSGMQFEGMELPDGERGQLLYETRFEEVVNDWPVGGWSVPDRNRITAAIAAMGMRQGKPPTRAELAREAGMSPGEFDFILRTIGFNRIEDPWLDPAEELPPGSVQVITDSDSAPGGGKFLEIRLGEEGRLLRTPKLPFQPGAVHLLSMDLRSDATTTGPLWFDIGTEKHFFSWMALPDTGGEWKRVGVFFEVPEEVKEGNWAIISPSFDLANVELRVATPEAILAATKAWRQSIVEEFPLDLTPPEGAGKHIAQTLAKLQGKAGLPDRPLVIWAIGNSWVNDLGRGDLLALHLGEHYPDAPEIVYRKIVGSGTPISFARGWAMTGVLEDQPDLILIYGGGVNDDMISFLQKHTTADIIVGSRHPSSRLSLEQIKEMIQTPPRQGSDKELADLCDQYDLEFVSANHAVSRWLVKNEKEVMHLMRDHTHQSSLGSMLSVEEFVRHLVAPLDPDTDFERKERRIDLAKAFEEKLEGFEFSGDWEVREGRLVAASNGASIRFEIPGNRVDLTGYRTETPASLDVHIDGNPADQAPAFHVGFVEAAPSNEIGSRNVGPHGVLLGDRSAIVPQTWTLRTLDDQGNFELTGSETGIDGKGNSIEEFKSDSRQIILDPALWRSAQDNDGNFRTVEGDIWTFEVSRASIAKVDFQGEPAGIFSVTLVDNLPPPGHTLEFRAKGPVELDSLFFFTPPAYLAQAE